MLRANKVSLEQIGGQLMSNHAAELFPQENNLTAEVHEEHKAWSLASCQHVPKSEADAAVLIH